MSQINLKIFAFVMILALSGNFNSMAQEQMVVGKITTFGVFGINKASVINDSSGFETFSDSLGFYSVSCNPEDKLTFSANGFFF